MHLEDGNIIGDTADEAAVIAEAQVVGLAPWDAERYPRDYIYKNPMQYRQNLFDTLEGSDPQNAAAVVVRGLTRISMSSRKQKLVPLNILSQLADKAVRPAAD